MPIPIDDLKFVDGQQPDDEDVAPVEIAASMLSEAINGSGEPGEGGGLSGAIERIADANILIAEAIKDLAAAIREKK